MLKQQQQNVFDEIEVGSLLNITIDTDSKVFAENEDENMEWSEIRSIRAVWIRAVLEKYSDAVEIEDLREG